jgi:hypothetical protein
MIKASQALRACQIDKCKDKVDANEKFEKKLQQKIITLSNKKGTLTKDQFNQEMTKINKFFSDSKTNDALVRCAIISCNKQLQEVMLANLDIISTICGNHHNTKLCNAAKKHKENMSKKVTYNQYKKYMNDVMSVLSD